MLAFLLPLPWQLTGKLPQEEADLPGARPQVPWKWEGVFRETILFGFARWCVGWISSIHSMSSKTTSAETPQALTEARPLEPPQSLGRRTTSGRKKTGEV